MNAIASGYADLTRRIDPHVNNETGTTLDDIAGKVQDSIVQIGKKIDQFKV